MLDATANIYRVLAAVLVVLLFFITGRPFFSRPAKAAGVMR
jgi:hypothetical protein